MMIGRIRNATRVIGKSQGYLGLPLRDEIVLDTSINRNVQSMVTAWIPTPDEIAAIVAGAPIHLRILGSQHPPVLLTVGEVPA